MPRQWSLPLRVSGQRRLSDIPVEIYYEILGYLAPHETLETSMVTKRRLADLLCLSLVCQLFRVITVPLIFRILYMSPRDDDEVPQNSRYHSLVRNIHHQVPGWLLPHVKRIVFRGWGDWLFAQAQGRVAKAFLNKRSDTLLEMSSLTTVVLVRTPITAQLFENIRDIPHLESLTLEYCNFSDISASTLQKHTLRFQSRLRKLNYREFENPYREPGWRQKFKAIFPLFANLLELTTNSAFIISALVDQSVSVPVIQHMDVFVDYYDLLPRFFEFLYRTPTLRSLALDSVLYWDPFRDNNFLTTNRLSLSRMGNLQSLTVPPFLVGKLADSCNLSQLSFVTHRPQSPGNTYEVISRAIITSAHWFSLSRYTTISELYLPYSFALAICQDYFESSIRRRTVVLENLRKLSLDFIVPVPSNSGHPEIGAVLAIPFICECFGQPSLKELFLVNFKDLPTGNSTKGWIGSLTQRDRAPELEFVSFSNVEGMDSRWRKSRFNGEFKVVHPNDY